VVEGCKRKGRATSVNFKVLPPGREVVWAFSPPGVASGITLEGWFSGCCDAIAGAG